MPTSRISSSYSLTLRIEYANTPGMLGRVTSVIGEQGGNIGAIDIVTITRNTMTRDITFAASDQEQVQHIIAALRAIGGVDIIHDSDRTFLMHLGGKLEIHPKVPIKNRDDLSMVYTPGVARIAQAIADHPDDVFNLTIKRNTVAIVTDGSQVLGLGNAGPNAALPVMESKAILLKEFAGIDAFPICLDVANSDEMVAAVKAIAPGFGAIHLEDICPPRCFEIEMRLDEVLDIPVMHNDQHGTAMVVLAALINALQIIGKQPADLRVVVNGRGAAGIATTRLLMDYGVRDIIICDKIRGALTAEHVDPAHPVLAKLVPLTNPRGVRGRLPEALQGADVFIGFGESTILEPNHIAAMNDDPIVFAMANPAPEIEPASIEGIARVIATGKSDFPNQINNMLCFPGFFRGLLDARASSVNGKMKLAAAHAIAGVVGRGELHEDYLMPSVFDRRVAPAVAAAVVNAAVETGVARRTAKPQVL
ncbi:MAG TPA: NAD-dependent malic enzyme [Abditibacteriaceae bacterium]|nr:NAD-dependent malic enzyme [Abditibacteriaceae bacterium]